MVRINTAEPRRAVLHQQLWLVLRDIGAGVHRISKQHEIIAKLDAEGHDTTEALRELAIFERVHALNIASHRQIMRKLEAADQFSPLRQRRSRMIRSRRGRSTRRQRRFICGLSLSLSSIETVNLAGAPIDLLSIGDEDEEPSSAGSPGAGGARPQRKTARAAQAPAVSPPGLPLQTRRNLGTFSSESTTPLVERGRATRKRLVPDLARSGSYCMRSPQATRLRSATWSRPSTPPARPALGLA
jgi:hypothetical protein